MTAQASGPRPGPLEGVFQTYSHDAGDYPRLLAFLTAHPELAQALMDAHRWVEGIFGTAELTLHLLSDPVDGQDELFVMVQTDHDMDTALSLLEEFDQLWVEKTSPGLRMLLTLDLDILEHAVL